MTHLLLMRPLWSKRGEKTLDGTFWVGRDRQDPLQKVKLKCWNSSLLLPLFLRQVLAGHSHPFPSVTEVPRSSCLGLSEVLLFRTTIKFYLLKHDGLEREREKKKPPGTWKPASSPWPPLELSFQLNDNRFCHRNCYVIWCMGVIWLRTRDRSTKP